MIQDLEWGGIQQLTLLFRSSLVGVGVGVLFDLMTGFWRGTTKLKRFMVDVVFCLLASIITFFSSLVLTDGKLHPVLFVGMYLGVYSEHVSLGRWVSRGACRSVWFVRNGFARMKFLASTILRKAVWGIRKKVSFDKEKAENVKKTRK